ncbi:GntR family transcriptional regulator [Massilia sp. Root335]|uniref:GntR family transcriptional regulator n=1 Tax=Massilia sp. Root335 TaxID=1736517 RepID=UPI0006F7B267|nr:GntR family transcriptional regulator [Massilia sp. Root335]KQV33197.1 GntR family transcriptional regulator [Massilia sp. Root335]
MPTHPASLFSIATGSPEPIYRQLVEQVRRLSASGQLRPGDEMPSVREIAQALALNPMTVSKAYGLLEMDGVLARRRGLGMVVADSAAPAGKADILGLLRPTLERAAVEARQLELDPDTVLSLFATILKEKK